MLLRLTVLIAALLAFLSMSAYSQTSPEQKKLPQQLEGKWENSQKCCFSGPIRVAVNSQTPDGKLTGTYFRTTPDGKHCSILGEPVPMTGTFDGTTLIIKPEIKQRFCEDSQFTFELKPSGRFEGTGTSWFQLKAFLEEKK